MENANGLTPVCAVESERDEGVGSGGTGDGARGHCERYQRAIAGAREQGPDSFQAWFNRSSGLRESLVRGCWDFAMHVLTPAVCARMERPEEKTALEIGYGGGRLLNAACGFFARVIGVDVHGEAEAVASLLRERGHANFELLQTDGRSLPVADASVDFVYSFIVLQHLPDFAALVEYVRATKRCLRPDGVGQLYYGDFGGRFAEGASEAERDAGYRELRDAAVNHVSLVVDARRMDALCEEAGLAVIDRGRSFRCAPDGFPGDRGGQRYVTVVHKS